MRWTNWLAGIAILILPQGGCGAGQVLGEGKKASQELVQEYLVEGSSR